MGITTTTVHSLSKQALGDENWHTALNSTLDDIDDLLQNAWIYGTAAEAIAQYEFIAFDKSAGKYQKANVNTSGRRPCLGIREDSASLSVDEAGRFAAEDAETSGPAGHSGFTAGKTIYLDTTNGVATETPKFGTNLEHQVLGYTTIAPAFRFMPSPLLLCGSINAYYPVPENDTDGTGNWLSATWSTPAWANASSWVAMNTTLAPNETIDILFTFILPHDFLCIHADATLGGFDVRFKTTGDATISVYGIVPVSGTITTTGQAGQTSVTVATLTGPGSYFSDTTTGGSLSYSAGDPVYVILRADGGTAGGEVAIENVGRLTFARKWGSDW